jgi:hypothetical protein
MPKISTNLDNLVPGCTKRGGGREPRGAGIRLELLVMRGGSFITTVTGGLPQLLRRCGRAFPSAGSVDLARDLLQHRHKAGN